MSAQRIAEAYACRDPLVINEDCIPWLTEDVECSGCGVAMVLVRQVGGIVDEVFCDACVGGSVH